MTTTKNDKVNDTKKEKKQDEKNLKSFFFAKEWLTIKAKDIEEAKKMLQKMKK